jgi:hypothetical protein
MFGGKKRGFLKEKKTRGKRKNKNFPDINRKSTQMGKGLVGIGRDIHI